MREQELIFLGMVSQQVRECLGSAILNAEAELQVKQSGNTTPVCESLVWSLQSNDNLLNLACTHSFYPTLSKDFLRSAV